RRDEPSPLHGNLDATVRRTLRRSPVPRLNFRDRIVDPHSDPRAMTDMIRFGRTGLKVCPLSFGTMTLGEPVDEKTSFRLLDLAFERGANFIDCANMYNAGLAETIVGKWLAARGNRDRVIISSKVRYRVGD